MKRRVVPFIVALGLIVLVIAGFFGVRLIERYTPSKEGADIGAILGVNGDQVAVYYNNGLQKETGIYVEGQTYLPIGWVNKELNSRFYWDRNEKLLVYALPESIVYADHTTLGSTGKPLIWVNDEGVYLSLGLIANYTDVRMGVYDTGEHKRVYIDNDWSAEQKAEVVRFGSIRVKGGIKSPILTALNKGETVSVLENLGKWDKVRSADGYIGYVEHKRLGKVREEKPVSSFVAPVYKNISLKEPVCLAWHQVTKQTGNQSFDRVINNTNGVNVISPTWFSLTDNEGGYTSLADKDYVRKAHEKGIEVWALIDNFNKNVKTEVLLSKTSVRQKLIKKLMADVDQYGLDGLNLDFEGIKKEAGVHYIQFIRELSVACRKKGVVLSVDDAVPHSSNEHYDRREQGIVADYVIVMGYDEHYSGGEAGSTASIGYVENGISDTLKEVPREKVINAIPFYTRVWTEGESGKTTSEAMGIVKAGQWIKDNHVNLYWQEELGQYYGELKMDKGRKEIWMEEKRSIGLKMDLIRKYQLAGVACWKLGLEPADIWDQVSQGKPTSGDNSGE